MIDHLVRDVQVLRKADMLIGKIWLKTCWCAGLGCLFFFATLIGVFGVGMANVAGYNALQRGTGNSESSWTARFRTSEPSRQSASRVPPVASRSGGSARARRRCRPARSEQSGRPLRSH